jgi:hypothetical protein
MTSGRKTIHRKAKENLLVFDVLVFNGVENVPVARDLSKRDAKRKVADLRQKGRKAQFVTAKPRNNASVVDEFDLPEIEDSNEE